MDAIRKCECSRSARAVASVVILPTLGGAQLCIAAAKYKMLPEFVCGARILVIGNLWAAAHTF